MKKTKLSIIAATAILGSTLFFVGCGNNSTSAGAGIAGVKATVLEGLATATNGTAAEDKNTTTVTNGKFVFTGGLTKDYNVTVHPGAWVDADESGDINKTAGIDFKTIQALTTTGDSKVASSLTTYAMAKAGAAGFDFDAFMAKVANFNPVDSLENLDDDETAALVFLATVLDEIILTNGDMTTVPDLNISEMNSTTAVNAVNFINPVLNAKKTLAANSIDLVKAAKEAGLSVSELKSLFVQIVDAKLPADTVIANIDFSGSDTNETAFKSDNSAKITATDNAVNVSKNASPLILSIGDTIKLGSETVAVSNNTFNHSIDVNSSKPTKLSDFLNIELSANASGNLAKYGDANITVTITDKSDTNNTLVASIKNANIKVDDNNKTTTTLNTNTMISLVSQGLGNTVNGNGTLNSTLTNNDLAFNVNTVIGALSSAGQTSVNDAISTLDDYLVSKSNTYGVKIAITTSENLSTVNSVEGTITVVKDGAAAPAVEDDTTTTTPDTNTTTPDTNTTTPDDNNTSTGGSSSLTTTSVTYANAYTTAFSKPSTPPSVPEPTFLLSDISVTSTGTGAISITLTKGTDVETYRVGYNNTDAQATYTAKQSTGAIEITGLTSGETYQILPISVYSDDLGDPVTYKDFNGVFTITIP